MSRHIAPVAKPNPCDKQPSSGEPFSEKKPLKFLSILANTPIEIAKKMAT